MICLEEAQQRQPEKEHRPLYSKRSRVEPLGRVTQITEDGLYWLRVKSRLVVVKVRGKEDEGWIVVDTHNGRQVKISPEKFRTNARNLARCPVCHVLHYEMPKVGRGCLACQTGRQAAKAGGG